MADWRGCEGAKRHRTTEYGDRAWCCECREWCYPHHRCVCCFAARAERYWPKNDPPKGWVWVDGEINWIRKLTIRDRLRLIWLSLTKPHLYANGKPWHPIEVRVDSVAGRHTMTSADWGWLIDALRDIGMPIGGWGGGQTGASTLEFSSTHYTLEEYRAAIEELWAFERPVFASITVTRGKTL